MKRRPFWLALALLASGAAALLLGSASAVADVIEIDSFEDGNVLGWRPDEATFPGSYVFESGDYVFQPDGLPGHETLLSVSPVFFERWSEFSARASARLVGAGKAGVAARYNAQADTGYAGWLNSSGRLELLRLDQGHATLLASHDTAGLFPAGSDVWLELSAWNDELTFSAGLASQYPLAQVSAVDPTYGAGQTGLIFEETASASAARFHEFSWISMYRFPGDIDENRAVDLSDFGILKSLFGREAFGGPDLDFSGKVDLRDFGILKDNFGNSAGPRPVPEPATAFLALLASVLWCARRSAIANQFADRDLLGRRRFRMIKRHRPVGNVLPAPGPRPADRFHRRVSL